MSETQIRQSLSRDWDLETANPLIEIQIFENANPFFEIEVETLKHEIHS